MNMNNGNDSLGMEDQWQNFANQNDQQNSVFRQAYDSQRADLADAQNMMNVVNQQKSRQLLNIQNANGVIMWAARNGGVTPELQNWWNAKCRTSDSDSQLVGAGFDKNGVFKMTFADGNGQFQSQMSCTPLQQYQMMNNMPGIFDENSRMMMREKLMSEGHSEQELAKYSGLAGMQGIGNMRPTSMRLGANGWEATSGELAAPGPRPRHGGISVFSTNGSNYRIGTADEGFKRQDFSADHPANANPNGQWRQMSVGPSSTFNGKDDKSQVRVYENSKTGERVTVKDGETPPWQRGSISDRLKIAAMNEQGRNARQDKRLSSKEQLAAMNKSAPKYDQKLYEDLKKDLEGMEYETSDDGSPDYTRPKTLNDDQRAEIEARKQYLRDIRWGAIGYGQQNGDNPPPDGNPPPEENPPATQKVVKVGEKVATAESVRREIERRRNGSINGNLPFKNISDEAYAQLSEEDKKKCKQVAKGRGYVMYLDNPKGSTSVTKDGKPYPETLKGVDDDWDFSNEERDDFNRLAKKYPNEFIKGEESTNEAYRELYERLKKKEEESLRRKENALKISSSKKKKATYKPGKFPY